ncbi:hypothetical protein [Paenibacillus sp. NPDC058174]|uniref:hypothetical protein n=1 Tax=Paenibacillus sp. NPDC058174 TaxID=3346366 RepID=UPI0036DA6159
MKKTSQRSIYVLLTDTGTAFTRLIKGFTKAPYNHASLAFDDELNEVFSFGRKEAHNPFVGGFVREDIYRGTFRHFPNTRCLLLRLPVTEQQHANSVACIRHFQRNQDAYRYHLIGLLGVLLQREIKSDSAYFCSQFVAEALKRSGVELWDRPSGLVTPNDFKEHDQFEVVYEGMLYDYHLVDKEKLGPVPPHPLYMALRTSLSKLTV